MHGIELYDTIMVLLVCGAHVLINCIAVGGSSMDLYGVPIVQGHVPSRAGVVECHKIILKFMYEYAGVC